MIRHAAGRVDQPRRQFTLFLHLPSLIRGKSKLLPPANRPARAPGSRITADSRPGESSRFMLELKDSD